MTQGGSCRTFVVGEKSLLEQKNGKGSVTFLMHHLSFGLKQVGDLLDIGVVHPISRHFGDFSIVSSIVATSLSSPSSSHSCCLRSQCAGLREESGAPGRSWFTVVFTSVYNQFCSRSSDSGSKCNCAFRLADCSNRLESCTIRSCGSSSSVRRCERCGPRSSANPMNISDFEDGYK